jgi:hypothetical protein
VGGKMKTDLETALPESLDPGSGGERVSLLPSTSA